MVKIIRRPKPTNTKDIKDAVRVAAIRAHVHGMQCQPCCTYGDS